MDTKINENSYLVDWLSFTIQTDINGRGKKAVREFWANEFKRSTFNENETGRHESYNRSLSLQNYINKAYYNEVNGNDYGLRIRSKFWSNYAPGVHWIYRARLQEFWNRWWTGLLVWSFKSSKMRIFSIDIALDDFHS